MIPKEVLNLVCDVNEREISHQIMCDNLGTWTQLWRNEMIKQLVASFKEKGENNNA